MSPASHPLSQLSLKSPLIQAFLLPILAHRSLLSLCPLSFLQGFHWPGSLQASPGPLGLLMAIQLGLAFLAKVCGLALPSPTGPEPSCATDQEDKSCAHWGTPTWKMWAEGGPGGSEPESRGACGRGGFALFLLRGSGSRWPHLPQEVVSVATEVPQWGGGRGRISLASSPTLPLALHST